MEELYGRKATKITIPAPSDGPGMLTLTTYYHRLGNTASIQSLAHLTLTVNLP